MDPLTFRYSVVYEPGDPEENPIRPGESPLNLIARAISPGPLLAVAWDRSTRQWTFQPRTALAMLHLHADRHRTKRVDRLTAEEQAAVFATTPLPTEAELTAICETALAAG